MNNNKKKLSSNNYLRLKFKIIIIKLINKISKINKDKYYKFY